MKLSVHMYPRVFPAGQEQTVYLEIAEPDLDPSLLHIQIIPMEHYDIPRTDYHLREIYRYPHKEVRKVSDGVFAVEHTFNTEQRHNIRIYYEGKLAKTLHAYSVEEDLAKLNCYKGDTHLHTNCSDGEGTPFEVACAYRRYGHDFIVVTDHHKYWPSIQARDEVAPLTKTFTVFPGEEVHNMGYGCFHIINMAGNASINELIESNSTYVQEQVENILKERDFADLADPRSAAFRIFVANEIRNAGGVAILPHPFWHTGDYNTAPEEFAYHFRNGDFDVLEVLGMCDHENNGNNLQELMRAELLAEGVKVPVCGASDAHHAISQHPGTFFDRQFTLAFAQTPEGIPEALKAERGVAVSRINDTIFHVVGRYRYAKYARFLLAEYFPEYANLTAKHADAMAEKNIGAIREAENAITVWKKKFFAI